MTTKLALTDLANGQANYLNGNTTFAQLNQLVQAGVVDKDLAAPPGSPADEALYIVASSPTGLWSGQAGKLAYWLSALGVWTFITPREGFLVHVNDEDLYYKYDGSAWGVFSGGGMANPMTTAGDLIVGGSAGVPTRLAIGGTDGFVLTRVAGAVAWAAATGGMSNPMTSTGDLIIGGSSGTPTRLAASTNGYVLTLVSGVPAWQAAGGGGFTGGTLSSALNEAPIVTIASSSTVNIGAAAANTISVSGTTTITAFDTIASGALRRVIFQGALTLTHNATSLILPTAANIVTAADDVAEFVSLGSGNWRCTGYTRKNGQALVAGGGLTGFTESLNTAAPNATVNTAALTVTGGTTNADAAWVAKGTGATLAQIPDSATTGGSKRGQYATDLQKARANAAQVASGNYSFIGGGQNGTADAIYATLVGGLTNYAAGQYSFVGGGQSVTANGNWSCCPGGTSNTVNGDYGVVGGGQSNSTAGGWSVSAGGNGNAASGAYSGIGGGQSNTASGQWSYIPGGAYATTRGIQGMEARANGRFSAQGDAQRGRLIHRQATTNATATAATADTNAAGTTNQFVLPNNCAFSFSGKVVARDSSAGNAARWTVDGLIKRGANAAATSIVGTPTVTQNFADAGATGWVVAVSADTTNGALTVTVTGAASTNIKWVADIETVEVVG